MVNYGLAITFLIKLSLSHKFEMLYSFLKRRKTTKDLLCANVGTLSHFDFCFTGFCYILLCNHEYFYCLNLKKLKITKGA